MAFVVALCLVALVVALCLMASPARMRAQSPNSSGVPSSAITWVVAEDGADRAAGTAADPFATVAQGLAMAVAGDIVLVRPGRYPGFDVALAGRADAPITVLGEPSGSVLIDGRVDGRRDTIRIQPGSAYVVLDGLTVTGSAGSRSAGILVDSVTSGPVSILRSRLTDNDGYGILITDSEGVTVADSELDHDRTGIEVNGAGAGVVISGNRIHDHDRLIRATPRSQDPNDDYGATGVSLVRTTGPVLVSDNQVWGNRAPSSDYGWDGSAFEIFGASGVTIQDNTAWDNENVLETGTADGMACADNAFVRNVAWGDASSGRARGIILRCGERMIIAADTLVDLDDYVLMIGQDSARFSGSIAGARVQNGLLVMSGSGAPLVITSPLPADLVLDSTLLWNDAGPLAQIYGTGDTADLGQLQAWTGQLPNGIAAPPRFADRRARDYRLTAGSPAIDAGVVVPGVTDGWVGSAPDLGAIEWP